MNRIADMIHCQNCGQENRDSDLFCRRCGIAFRLSPEPQEERRDFENSPPRPYSWSTGEFPKSRRGARSTRQIHIGEPLNDPFRTSELPARQGGFSPAPVYRCPHCGTTSLPIVTKRVSSAGWVVFTLLLVFTLFLFWIGLLLQEEVRVCSVCNRRVD